MQFVATLKQNAATVASTTRRATWTMRDGWVHGGFQVDATAAGSAGTEIRIAVTAVASGDQFLPSPLSTASNDGAIGTFEYLTSGGTRYWGELQQFGNEFLLRASGSTSTTSNLGETPSFAVANGDSVSGQFFYEAE